MKQLLFAALLVGALGAGATTLYVASDGAGDGSSWESATTFKAALETAASAEEPVEIRIKQGTMIVTEKASATVNQPLVIRGGYTGEDETTQGGVTSFDANFENITGILSLTVKGGLTLESCQFLNCRPTSAPYSAVSLTGTASVDLSISNCAFSGNQRTNVGADLTDGQGSMRGLMVQTFRKAMITDTEFLCNGVVQAAGSRVNNHIQKDWGARGLGLCVNNAPCELTRCRIAGNKFQCHCGNGSALAICGSSGGSVLRNCAIVGNLGVASDDAAGKNWAGICAFEINLANASDKFTLENCTLAYNSNLEYTCPAGLGVYKGTGTIRNCIFYANIAAGSAAEANKKPADVWAETGMSVTMSYCWTHGTGAAYVSGNVVQQNSFTGDDPGFVSDLAAYNDAVNLNVTKLPYSTVTSPNYKTSAEAAAALDVHLLSKAGRWNGTEWVADETSSGLLDMGDPASDYSNEPDYNGGAVNLGAYGNTSEASKSLKATPDFTETVDATGDYTMPHDTVVCGGEGIYHCDVYFCWGAEGTVDSLESWENKVLCKSDAKPGDTIDVRPMRYFDQDTELRWAVLFVELGGTAVEKASEIHTTTLAEPTPPWYGKGGGARVLHVRTGATGKMDGTSWTDAITTYDEAMAVLSANLAAYDEVWFSGEFATKSASTAVLELLGAFAFRGGFTGAENTPDERTADDTKATIDGQTIAYYLLNFKNDAGAVTVDRLTLTRAYRRSLNKTGTGDLTLKDSRFTDNSSAYDNVGRGACVTGSATTLLTVTNCLFDANHYTGSEPHGSSANYANGAGLYALTFAHIDLRDTVFRQNGLARSVRADRADYCSNGVGAYFKEAPVTANRVEFRNNLGCHHSQLASAMYLGVNCGGSAFTNCLWVGNCMMMCDTDAGISSGMKGGAAVVIDLGQKSQTVDFQNCTIAYNVMVSAYAPGGVNVYNGTVKVRDSIFWGNVTVYPNGGVSTVTPADLCVSSDNGYVDIDWCCIADPASATYLTQNAGRVLKGENFSSYDPLFATSTEDFRSLLLPAAVASIPGMTATSGWVSLADAVDNGLDVHLRSQDGRYLDGGWVNDAASSPVINGANPESDYANEPAPNGERANLGAYGNTTEASKSMPNAPALGQIDFDLTGDYTMPHAKAKCGGTGVYSAALYFCYGDVASEGSGTNGWENIIYCGIGHCQDEIDVSPHEYLPANKTISWRVVMLDASTGEMYGESDIATATTGGELPPWYQKGGSANVIHVRPGATGKATGANWSDAYTTYAEAIANVSAERNEIWVTGDFTWPQTTSAALTLTEPLTIRGGFAGIENDSAERAAGAQTKIDSRTMYRTFWFASDKPLTIDSFDVDGSSQCIFQKSGKGDLTLVNCTFRNSVASGVHNGVELDGNKTGKLTISGCSFAGCVATDSAKNTYNAHGLKVSNFTAVTMDDSLVASNGYARTKTESYQNAAGWTQGSGAWFTGNGSVVIRGTRFLNNVWACHCSEGCALWIDGSSSAALTNCLFAGNLGLYGDADSKGLAERHFYGAAVVKLAANDSPVDVVNCTFAYNKSNEALAPAGLCIMKGRGNILNSIFYCNVQPAVSTPVDVRAITPSFIDYCWVANTNTTYISDAATLTQGEHMLVGVELGGEPFFVTTTNDFKTVTGIGLGTLPVSTGKKCFAAAVDSTDWVNVHLRGKYGYTDELTGEKTVAEMPDDQLALGVKNSPCIDAGDPLTSYQNEAKANGKRVNLGFYGNTPWASTSRASGLFLIVK